MSYKALLFCPEDKTARVVTLVLTELDFRVEPCNETFAAVKKLMAEHFDAIVVDCDNEQNAALLFKSAHNSGSNQKSLAVAVVEGQAGVAMAFRIGANLVLTKPINVEQSKGTLRVARGLLRKTETSTPLSTQAVAAPTAPAPTPIAPAHQATPEKPVAKTKITSQPVSPPAAIPSPAVASSVFEVEQEPGPKPEPTEAAFLESISDTLASTKLTKPLPSATPKEHPWAPVAKPMSEPMTAALQRAAEVSSEFAEPGALTQNPAASTQFSSTPTFGIGTASAPAPAKESRQTHQDDSGLEPEAPLFTAVTGGETNKSHAGGSKKALIIAAVFVIAAVAGYSGWTGMHSGSKSISVPPAPKPSSPVQPQAGSTVVPPSIPQANTGGAPSQTQAAAGVPIEQGPDITLSTSEPTPAIAKSPSAATKQTITARPAAPQPPPLLVRGGSIAQPAPPPSTPDTSAPGMLALGSSSGDQVISGIVSAPATSVAQPAPQTLKISQGVAQGLLMRRVPPIYPQQAKQARIQGTVELQASIGKDGNITAVNVVSGDKTLALAAADAVKQWKYKPYLLDGQPVEIQTQITVNFKLPQ
jgi:protein TonB